MSLSNVSVSPTVGDSAPPAMVTKSAAVNGVTLIDAKNAVVIDSAGRAIKVKRLSAIDKMRLYRAVGATDSDNGQLMNYATLAAMVTELDGIPASFPASSLQIDAMVQRLDEHGLEAVLNAFIALAPQSEDVAAAAKNL